MCVRGGYTTHTYRGMQQTCIQYVHSQYTSVFFSLSTSLFYTRSPEHTPTHTHNPAQIHLHTHPFFISSAQHIEKHTQTYTCHAGLHSTSNTAADRHTHSLAPVAQGRWGGGVNAEIQPILKMLSWCTLAFTRTHRHRSARRHT